MTELQTNLIISNFVQTDHKYIISKISLSKK